MDLLTPIAYYDENLNVWVGFIIRVDSPSTVGLVAWGMNGDQLGQFLGDASPRVTDLSGPVAYGWRPLSEL